MKIARRKSLCVLMFLLAAVGINAQESFPQYGKPLDIPMHLSATFAEMRAGHPHSGLDIKTDGVEGKPVYAVADGYVSRISVSPLGYGNALYITHNDGYTSVYGHLQRFNPSIVKYVRNYQYAHKTFAAQIFPTRTNFPVKKGDVIAYSGNSGGSGGPHLHFEVRHTASEKPVNPMYFGYSFPDAKKPVITGVSIYPVEKATIEKSPDPGYFHIAGQDGRYSLKDKPVVHVYGKIAFGICSYDQVGASANKNGPYTYELFLDNALRFKVECDSFAFSENRYVNSLIDYQHYMEKGSRYIRTEVDPNNRLSMIALKDGTIIVNQGDTVDVSLRVTDYSGNLSRVDFKVVGYAPVFVEPKVHFRSEYFVKADGTQNSEINIEDFSVVLPKGTLFRDEWIPTGITDAKDCCSRIYRFGNDNLAVFKAFKVRIRPQEKWTKDTRMFIACMDDKNKVSSIGGKMVDGYLETETRSLGRYAIKIDSVAPVVSPRNFKDKQAVSALKSLRFKISDDMSGIDTYNIYLNDEWVLGQYDAKNALLYYDFDSHIKKGNNRVKVVVKDGVGNTKTYKATVSY